MSWIHLALYTPRDTQFDVMSRCVQCICTASKPVTLLLLFHKTAIYTRLYCDYDTQLLTLNPGGLMRPGYAYTEMCQRALQQALPQANVIFPQVGQAVWFDD